MVELLLAHGADVNKQNAVGAVLDVCEAGASAAARHEGAQGTHPVPLCCAPAPHRVCRAPTSSHICAPLAWAAALHRRAPWQPWRRSLQPPLAAPPPPAIPPLHLRTRKAMDLQEGMTPLICAAEQNKAEVVEVLLSQEDVSLDHVDKVGGCKGGGCT